MVSKKHVVIVGGGFAGMACAQQLVRYSDDFHVTLLDKNNYTQFKPLLYQIATSALSADDVACVFRNFFEGKPNIDIKLEEVISVDPHAQTVKTKSGGSYQGDYLILSAGSKVNFFGTEGAEQYAYPMYTLDDAEKLRSRLIAVFEEADRNPSLIDKGMLDFLIVGAGPTGTEVAGSLADMFKQVLPGQYQDLVFKKAAIHLVDTNHSVLGAFSKNSQEYATKALQKRGVQLHLGQSVKKVTPDAVILSDGNQILTRTIIWAGGLQAASPASNTDLPQGHGGRINVNPDLSVKSFPNLFALGDFANITDDDGKFLPQLASVAQQSGYWTAQNIINDLKGKSRTPFQYHDKGIMAMIGKDSAVVEVGEKRHQFEGAVAFVTWLGVHASLLYTFHQKFSVVTEWAWDYFGKTRPEQILDRKK